MKPYRISRLAQPYTDYDMIRRHTELPPFPDARAQLLYIFLTHTSSAGAGSAELYALVSGLVQQGLDTHENIDDPAGGEGRDPMRSRQLKVLAGDYFSSWYYQLLANSGEIETIGTLSEAIADYNVMKARLAVSDGETHRSPDSYLKHKVQLNMRLFLSFTPLIHPDYQAVWNDLLYAVAAGETVLTELQRGAEPVSAHNGYCYLCALEAGDDTERELLESGRMNANEWMKLKLRTKSDTLLADKLRQAVAKASDVLRQVRHEALLEELSALLENLQSTIKQSGQAAGEG